MEILEICKQLKTSDQLDSFQKKRLAESILILERGGKLTSGMTALILEWESLLPKPEKETIATVNGVRFITNAGPSYRELLDLIGQLSATKDSFEDDYFLPTIPTLTLEHFQMPIADRPMWVNRIILGVLLHFYWDAIRRKGYKDMDLLADFKSAGLPYIRYVESFLGTHFPKEYAKNWIPV